MVDKMGCEKRFENYCGYYEITAIYISYIGGDNMKITKEQAKKLALKIQERITKYQEDIEEASYGNPYNNEEYYIEQEFKEEMIDI